MIVREISIPQLTSDFVESEFRSYLTKIIASISTEPSGNFYIIKTPMKVDTTQLECAYDELIKILPRFDIIQFQKIKNPNALEVRVPVVYYPDIEINRKLRLSFQLMAFSQNLICSIISYLLSSELIPFLTPTTIMPVSYNIAKSLNSGVLIDFSPRSGTKSEFTLSDDTLNTIKQIHKVALKDRTSDLIQEYVSCTAI